MIFQTNTVIGHRGCDSAGQNNTIPAFLKAFFLGAEAVEMDIRKTRDDQLVVFHDAEIEGMRLRGSLYTDLHDWAEKHEIEIPLLEDVLKALRGKASLFVELKEVGYESLVVEMLLKYFSADQFVIISFNDQSIAAVKRSFSEVKAGLLLGRRGRGDAGIRGVFKVYAQKWSEFFPWKRLRRCNADFVLPNYHLLILNMHKVARDKGVPIVTWAVNDKRVLKFLMESHCLNGIITDKPEVAVKVRNNL